MLKGEHVGLRAIERADLPKLLEWRNRPELRRHFREYRELGIDQQTEWYETKVLKDPCVRMFSVVDARTGDLLGACGLCYIDWPNRNADLSVYIGAADLYIDDRLAPDAVKVLLRYGFEELNLHRVWSEIYELDGPKKRMFESLGFHLDGRHLETHWSEGR